MKLLQTFLISMSLLTIFGPFGARANKADQAQAGQGYHQLMNYFQDSLSLTTAEDDIQIVCSWKVYRTWLKRYDMVVDQESSVNRNAVEQRKKAITLGESFDKEWKIVITQGRGSDAFIPYIHKTMKELEHDNKIQYTPKTIQLDLSPQIPPYESALWDCGDDQLIDQVVDRFGDISNNFINSNFYFAPLLDSDFYYQKLQNLIDKVVVEK